MTRTILVVDDDPDFVELVKVLLRDSYAVEGCTNSRDALQRIRRVEPVLVFLDLNMPPPNGWELLRTLRGDPSLAHLPILVVSASGVEASFDERLITKAPGRLEILAKPFEIEDLARKVSSLLQQGSTETPTDQFSASQSIRVDLAI